MENKTVKPLRHNGSTDINSSGRDSTTENFRSRTVETNTNFSAVLNELESLCIAKGPGLSNQRQVREVIEERGIIRVCHFTRIENLESMLSKGYIYSREELESLGINRIDNDPRRFDGHKKYICCSIMRPNRFLLSKWINENTDGRNDWIVLCIDPQIMARQCSFSSVNAATGGGQHIREGIEALESMFANTVTNRRGIITRPSGREKYFTTDEQAEVLIKGRIPINERYNKVKGIRYEKGNLVVERKIRALLNENALDLQIAPTEKEFFIHV